MDTPAEGISGAGQDSVLLPGETALSSLSSEDGEFRLTPNRVVFTGRGESAAVFTSAHVADVTAVEISRRPRESRSAWWGGLGLIAAIGVWQVSSNPTVGGVAAAIVALISLALLADYWFRPGGVILAFRTPGSSVQGVIPARDIDAARQFIAQFEQVRAFASGRGVYGPTAGYDTF